MQSQHSHRKDEHYFLAEKFYQDQATSGLSGVRFVRAALPETKVAEVDLNPQLPELGWQLPLFINAMTGGSATTGKINADLAQIAATLNLPIASGSESVIFADRSAVVRDSFTVLRSGNRDGFVLANIGVDKTPEQAVAAVNLIAADMLEVHLNAVQELVMPEGGRDYVWGANLAAIVAASPVPVLVKEVGFGMRRDDIKRLARVGVHYVDVGGRGGTNFATIENARRPRSLGDLAYLSAFGQNTAESLLEVAGTDMTIFATGGIRTPLDAIAALRLGASAVGIAGLVLHTLTKTDVETTTQLLRNFLTEMAGIMALLGCKTIAELRTAPIVLSAELRNYADQRGLTIV